MDYLFGKELKDEEAKKILAGKAYLFGWTIYK